MTSSLAILRDIGDRRGPAKVLVAFGYAAWGPDQLEHEIEVRAWGIAEADPTLVFDEDRDNVWRCLEASHRASLNARKSVNPDLEGPF